MPASTRPPNITIELLKVLHCLSFEEFCEMMELHDPDQPTTFWMRERCAKSMYLNDLFKLTKSDLFAWLCRLSPDGLITVLEFAEKKAIWQKLRSETVASYMAGDKGPAI